MQLASSFRYGSPMLRADSPLSDDQIRRVPPSIFADGKHESRSERYTYIPTIDVLRGLRNEGFQPFMVCQTRVRAQDTRDEQHAFARSALALRYDPTDTEAPAPITESQLLNVRRFEDRRDDLWTVFNRIQESLTKGGLHGRSRSGRSMSTRPVTGIDQNVKLNRALWMLADAMRQMKA